MSRRIVFFCVVLLLFCSGLSLGIIIGYVMGSGVNVIAYDPAVHSPPESLNLDYLRELENSDPDNDTGLYRQFRGLKPLVLAGPFGVYLNPTNFDFVITREGDMHSLVEQFTVNNQTELVFYGRGGHAVCTFTYSKDTDQVLASQFVSHGEGGLLGPIICCYGDCDGDGRFESLIDAQSGKVYQQKGLQWVELSSSSGSSGSGRD